MASTIEVDQVKHSSGVAFTLPTADGSAGHLLKTNGSRVLSFVADTDTGIVTIVEDTSPQLGGFLDANGNYIQMQKGGDIASASPTVIDTDGDYFICTGTTGFSAFTVAADRHFFLEFSGALIMTHGAGTLDLPSGANITTVAGDVGEFVSTASNVVTCVNYTRATGKALVASHDATVGVQTIWIPAVAMYPTTTNGCADLAQVEITAQKPEVKSLDFDASTDEYAQFAVAFPKSWNESTVTFQTYWTVTGTNAGTGCFQLAGVAVSSDDPFGATFGTQVANTALAASGTANDLMVNVVSGAVTIGGTPAEGDQVFFQINRDISADTQTADIRLVGVKIYFTTNAENDA